MLRAPAYRSLRQDVVDLGRSGARVVRLSDDTGAVVAYAKTAADIEMEAARLAWLRERGVPVPEILDLVRDDGTWLVTRPVPGRPGSDPWPGDERKAVVAAIGEALRVLHEVDPAGCPFDRTLPSALAEARRRTREGLVDASWAHAGRTGVRAADVLEELDRAVAASPQGVPVVSHGDYCLPNALVAPDLRVGLVDVGRAGLADRHSDVADMLRSIRGPLNPQYGEVHAQVFLDAYGREGIREEELRRHDLMEEFYWPAPPR